MANLRPLQPAPLEQESLPPQSTSPLNQKPKRTMTFGACVACRKRKSKCDGRRPICACCSQKDTACIYELGPNERPSQAIKRKNEEMHGELSNLRQIFDFLRLRPEHESQELLRRIRLNPPGPFSQRIQDLAGFVRHGDVPHPPESSEANSPYQRNPEQSITLPPILRTPGSCNYPDLHSPSFHRVSSMESNLSNLTKRKHGLNTSESSRSVPPFTSIDAILSHSQAMPDDSRADDPRIACLKNWTTVITDSTILGKIFSAWDKLEHCYYHYLDREAFLDDLRDARTNFCSSLLVNALLASACVHSELVKDRQKPFAEASLTTVFYNEARRLWDMGGGEENLTRIQAGICLFLVLGQHGRDKAGRYFLLEACRIGRNLGLFGSGTSQDIQKPHYISTYKWCRARAITAWGLFNFQLAMSTMYMFPLVLDTVPTFAIPHPNSSKEKALFQVFRAQCEKSIIILQYVNPSSSHDYHVRKRKRSSHSELVEACYYRLYRWWDCRPPEMDPDTYPTRENLLCAMIYNTNIVDLFRPALDSQVRSQTLFSDYTRARSVTTAALRHIRRLLSMHEKHHGWNSTVKFIMHPISVASFGSLDEISQMPSPRANLEHTEPYQGLLTCLRALQALSGYSYYAQPLFRVLAQKCEGQGTPLPLDAQHFMSQYRSEEWARDAGKMLASQYISDTRDLVGD